MNIYPSSFITMINEAASVDAVNHIYETIDYLYGFEYSPDDGGEDQWNKLIAARDLRIAELESA